MKFDEPLRTKYTHDRKKKPSLSCLAKNKIEKTDNFTCEVALILWHGVQVTYLAVAERWTFEVTATVAEYTACALMENIVVGGMAD